jgi:hypothetical protein
MWRIRQVTDASSTNTPVCRATRSLVCVAPTALTKLRIQCGLATGGSVAACRSWQPVFRVSLVVMLLLGVLGPSALSAVNGAASPSAASSRNQLGSLAPSTTKDLVDPYRLFGSSSPRATCSDPVEGYSMNCGPVSKSNPRSVDTNVSLGRWVQEDAESMPLGQSNIFLTYDARDNYSMTLVSAVLTTPCNGSYISAETWALINGTWEGLNKTNPPGHCTYLGPYEMVYDVADGYVLFFGGGAVAQNETWTYENGTWVQLHLAHSPPPPGANAVWFMTYDSTDRYVLLFGGPNNNQTWRFSGGQWSLIKTTISPSAGVASLADDPPCGCVILASASGPTWEYQSGNWTLLPASARGPGFNSPPSLFQYDAYYGLIMFARASGALWTYENGTWWQVLASGPCGGSSGAGICDGTYDSKDGALVEYLLYNGTTSQPAGDTWLFGSGLVSLNASPPQDGLLSVNSSQPLSTNSTTVTELGFGNYTVTASAEPWMRFSHWTVSGNLTLMNVTIGPFSSTARLVVRGNGSLGAVFRPAPYVSVLIDPASCGPITFNGQLYPNGSRPEFLQGTYTAAAGCVGYHFYRWEGSANVTVASPADASTSVGLESGNGSLEAVFALNVTLAIDPVTDGSVTVHGARFPDGTTMTLPVGNYSLQATPDAWAKFAGWTQIGVGIRPTNDSLWVRGPGDATLIVHFVLFPELTVSVGLPGTAYPTCLSYTLDNASQSSGSPVQLTLGSHSISATELCEYTANSVFSRWVASSNVSVASPTQNKTTIVVEGNGTLTATYQSAYWVRFEGSGGGGTLQLNGSGIAEGSEQLLTNGSYPLTATPSPGFQLTGWIASGSVRVGNGTLIVAGPGTVTAEFSKIPPPPGNSSPPPSSTIPWVLVSGIAVGAAAALIGAAIVLRRRRKPG